MFEDFRITRVKRGAYFDMNANHMHARYEIYYLIDGMRKLFYDDSIYLLFGGDLVFIPKNTIHRTMHLNDRVHERYVVTFGDGLIADFGDALGEPDAGSLTGEPVLHFAGADRDYVEGLLARMLAEYERPDALSQVNVKNCLQELMVFLMRYGKGRRDERAWDIDTADRLMQKAARYIRGNYMKDIDLRSIAAYVGLSPCYFSKKFKACTGFGYREYLQLVRVREASALLLETNRSVAEIARGCGFSNSNYFGDAFRREKGVSPLKYRRDHRREMAPAEDGGAPKIN